MHHELSACVKDGKRNIITQRVWQPKQSQYLLRVTLSTPHIPSRPIAHFTMSQSCLVTSSQQRFCKNTFSYPRSLPISANINVHDLLPVTSRRMFSHQEKIDRWYDIYDIWYHLYDIYWYISVWYILIWYIIHMKWYGIRYRWYVTICYDMYVMIGYEMMYVMLWYDAIYDIPAQPRRACRHSGSRVTQPTMTNSTAVCYKIFYFGFKEWRDWFKPGNRPFARPGCNSASGLNNSETTKVSNLPAVPREQSR